MASRIAIIEGHPDPAGGHLCQALAETYAAAALSAGHDVERIDLAKLDFPLLRSQAEFEHGELPEALKGPAQAIHDATHIVMVFPLWLGTMPALLKAFLEQVMRPGTAFAYRPRGFPQRLLDGHSCRLVVTMGMPACLYRYYFGAHGLKGLERNILNFVGIRPVRETLLGNVGSASEATRQRWLDDMRELGRQAA